MSEFHSEYRLIAYLGRQITTVQHDFYKKMVRRKTYAVYIMTNKNNTVLYIGVTNNVERRVMEHKNCLLPSSFTSRYKITKLLWYETTYNIEEAIKREKQLKAWRRSWKKDLINESFLNGWICLGIGFD